MHIFELNSSQLAAFNKDGFTTVDNLIDASTVIRLRERFEHLFSGHFETGVTPDEVNWQYNTGDTGLTRQICNGWKADRLIASVVLRNDLGKAIAKLGNWPGTRIMIDNVLWKPPGARSLGYHQDSAFLSWYTPSDLISCWIALDDTQAEGGTLEFARGSHHWQRGFPEGEFHGPADYRQPVHKAARAEGEKLDIGYVEVPRGGGSFHHGWTWHGSGHNTTSQPRRALVIHAMRSDAQFNPDNLQQGTGPIYGRYKRLTDTVMDENHFPVLCREDGYRTPFVDDYLSKSAQQ